MHPTPHVFLVDDHPGIRKALTRLLKAEGFEVAAFDSAHAFLDSGQLMAPGCVVLDLSMPGMDGMALQQALVDAGSELAIIFLTGQGDLAAGVQAMKRGAVDFLPKPVNDVLLLAAVRAGLEKNQQALQLKDEQSVILGRLATLTPREREVFELVVAGKLNKQIASLMGTVEKTIKTHRARVMEKMHAQTLAHLVRMGARCGIDGEDRPQHPN